MTLDYRKKLIASINNLIQLRHSLFGEALNLALLGDLSEANDAFEVGDKYKFELLHLKDNSDSNVSKLVYLIEEIQDAIDSLINVNEIDDGDINWEGNKDGNGEHNEDDD